VDAGERELLLLGLLRQGDMHGYRLNEFIERDLALCTDLKKPTAYFLLEKMEKAGWIERYNEQSGNRPQRRVYRVTEAGEAAFQSILRENLVTHNATRFVSDIGLAFADSLPPAEVVGLLNQQRDALLHDLESMRTTVPHQGTIQLLIDHRRFHLESELKWLDEVIQRFQG